MNTFQATLLSFQSFLNIICDVLWNFPTPREEWMWAIQSVANGLKMREQDKEEPMDLLGSPNECSLEEMEVATSKRCSRVVRPFDLVSLLFEVHIAFCFTLFVCVAGAVREAQTALSPVTPPAPLGAPRKSRLRWRFQFVNGYIGCISIFNLSHILTQNFPLNPKKGYICSKF